MRFAKALIVSGLTRARSAWGHLLSMPPIERLLDHMYRPAHTPEHSFHLYGLEIAWRRHAWDYSLHVLNAQGFRAALSEAQRDMNLKQPNLKLLGLRLLDDDCKLPDLSRQLLDAFNDTLSAFSTPSTTPLIGLSCGGNLVAMLNSNASAIEIQSVLDELLQYVRWRAVDRRSDAIAFSAHVCPSMQLAELDRRLNDCPMPSALLSSVTSAASRIDQGRRGGRPAGCVMNNVQEDLLHEVHAHEWDSISSLPNLTPREKAELTAYALRRALIAGAAKATHEGTRCLVRVTRAQLEALGRADLSAESWDKLLFAKPLQTRVAVDAQAAWALPKPWRMLCKLLRGISVPIGLYGLGVHFGPVRHLPRLKPDFVVLSDMISLVGSGHTSTNYLSLKMSAWAEHCGVATVIHRASSFQAAKSLWSKAPEALVLLPSSMHLGFNQVGG